MDPLRPDDPEAVGEFRLLGRLGSGGMGVVYLGRSPGGRLVAVKSVHRELAEDPEFRARFAQEVEAARRVGGFHTAHVVAADPTAERPWLVTAYIPGLSMSEAIAQHGPMTDASLRMLGAGLAEALKAIHAVGLIHRDLKPSNVLLAEDGPRVIDFGIARLTDATALTRSHARIGSPGFMAPEQLTGEPVGPATDVFALGCVLCAAAGCRPFGDGPTQALLYRMVHQDPDLSEVPAGLRPIIAACLAKDPAARPTPADLLERFGSGSISGRSWPTARLRTAVVERTLALPDQQEEWRTVPDETVREQPIGATDVLTEPPFGDDPGPPPVPERKASTGNRVRPWLAALTASGVGLILVLVLAIKPGFGGHPAAASTGGTTAPASTSPSSGGRQSTPPSSSPSSDPDTPSAPPISPSASAPFDPDRLNAGSTDQTPLTDAAMLPETVAGNDDSQYSLISSETDSCTGGGATSNVQAVLTAGGCGDALVADYLGPGATSADGDILVSLEIIPFSDSTTASQVRNELIAFYNSQTAWHFGFWCPTSGPGAGICTGTAAGGGDDYVMSQYRYVLIATATYINSSAAADNWTWMDPGLIARACGPAYYLTTV